MSFLPGSLTPALLRSRRHKLHITRFRASTKTRSFRCSSSPQKVINFLGTPVLAKSYPIRTVIQLLDVGKTKRADHTEHQKSAGAWLSLQSDVLCNRLWKFKVGFCFIQLPPTEPKAWWSSSALPVYRYRVGWNRLNLFTFQDVFPSGSRWGWRFWGVFTEYFLIKVHYYLQMVADENIIFRTTPR